MQSRLVQVGLACFALGVVVQAGFAQAKKPTFSPDLFNGKDTKAAATGLLDGALQLAESGSWERIAVGRAWYLGGDKAKGQEIFGAVTGGKKVEDSDWFRHDILWYGLYEAGSLVDEYTSAPDYFEGGGAPPTGVDATRLCAAFARPGVEAVLHGILHRPKDAPDAYTFETDRHAAVVQALGLPSAAVGTGYNYLEGGELPPELAMDDLVRVG